VRNLEGLVAIEEPRLNRTDYDESMTGWSAATDVTDAYLVVRDVAAGSPGSPEGDMLLNQKPRPVRQSTGQSSLHSRNGDSASARTG
jgi:hypothetical protein